jgi:2-phospho-L-lactate/phosphoenolpyruvate guanylyltransferase
MGTVAVLPVKSFTKAKRRLTPGIEAPLRSELAAAMFSDVLAAVASSSVDEVVVVTAGEAVRAHAHAHGARVIRDAEQGHNAAARIGLREALRLGADRALLVPGDCPALDSAELDQLLSRSGGESVIIVPDRHGTGTNALLITPPGALDPSFGPASCQRHVALAEAAGIAHAVVTVPSLALDIDTPEDLDALGALGDRAPRTHGLLSRC